MTKRPRVLLVLALRNLIRHVRRSVLTSLAMILGGGLLIFSLVLGDGTHEAWIDSAVRMGSGHLSVQAPGYDLSRKIEDRLSARARASAESALARPEVSRLVVAAAPRLAVSGLASSAAGARPVHAVGVDPATERKFTELDEKLVEGRYLEEGDRLAAYVGAVLAASLELALGSRLVLTAQDASGEIAGQLVRVVGIFRTGVPEIDQSLVHLPLETAGEWLGSGRDITHTAVLVERSDDVPALARVLRRELGELAEAGALDVLTWRQSMPELDAAVTIDDFGNYLFQGILFSIIALGIVNTVLMSVLHRHREFGVLQALGLTPNQTGSLVLVEGLILTAVSGVLGVALGVFVTWYFFGEGLDFSAMWDEEWTFAGVVMEPVVVPYFRVARVVQATLFILGIGALASLYPAFRATRIDVTEAMKFER